MDKPFKTIDEQIAMLNLRGLSTDEQTGIILRQEGYYSVVNGYKDLFIDKAKKSAAAGDDRYKDGVEFKDIYRLFEFDRSLRSTMLKYFAIAEAKLKTACAYCFSERFKDTPEAYLDANHYRQESNYAARIQELIAHFCYTLSKDPNNKPVYKRDYMEHYVRKHDAVPLWVLFNYMDFGIVCKFFEFQKESMRNTISKYFSDFYKNTHTNSVRIYENDLRLSYDHIKEFRNICAHDERLYCARVSPAKDISLSHVINKDISKVLQERDETAMRETIANLIINLRKEMPGPFFTELFEAMGFNDLSDLL